MEHPSPAWTPSGSPTWASLYFAATQAPSSSQGLLGSSKISLPGVTYMVLSDDGGSLQRLALCPDSDGLSTNNAWVLDRKEMVRIDRNRSLLQVSCTACWGHSELTGS